MHHDTPADRQETEHEPQPGAEEAGRLVQAEVIRQAEAARRFLEAQRRQRIAVFQAALQALLDEHRMALVPQVTINAKGYRADLLIEPLD